MFEIVVCETDKEKDKAFAIREEVFVNEQGFSLEIERDEYDSDAVHVIGCEDGIPIACGRMVELDRKAKIGRIAVLKDYRGKNYGKKICEFLIDKAKAFSPTEIYLHSQVQAENFYIKAGFVRIEEIFLEEGAEHIKMVYKLT